MYDLLFAAVLLHVSREYIKLTSSERWQIDNFSLSPCGNYISVYIRTHDYINYCSTPPRAALKASGVHCVQKRCCIHVQKCLILSQSWP